jgi:hypothetical protein
MTVSDVLKDNPGLGRAEALRRTMLAFLADPSLPLLARRGGRGALNVRDIRTLTPFPHATERYIRRRARPYPPP